jgi:predicted TIM-barrel fold metal-dependent hydrolase
MSDLDRRSFLRGAAASLGLAALVADGADLASAQGAAAATRRIDVHHHFAPPAWVAEVKGKPLLQAANTRWTPEQSIEEMDRGGVSAAVIEITNPGLWFGDNAAAARVSRACNDYGARLVQDHPTRFGLFAAMPLPDVDATLKEIEYAYDSLKVDGVGLFTSYGDMWLGNAVFRPVMEELNRRRAVVHVHPTAANCCRNLDYGAAPGSMEYGTDTTRAILGVAFNGDAARFPGIRFIWSHAGGTAPFLAGRVDGQSRGARDRMPNGFIAEAKKFFYDTAGASNRGAMTSLLELVSPSQILFGTDFPSGGSRSQTAQQLSALKLFDAAAMRAIDYENAATLMPRLKSVVA